MATAAVALACASLLGCSNPDAGSRISAATPGSPGEPPAPAAPAAGAQHPAGVSPTPPGALLAFADAYVNWDYRTLAAVQRSLAARAVGAARAAEQQAAASSGADRTIRAARIVNSGSVLSIAPERSARGMWVLVTREQTSGGQGYAGVPASDHVTLARLAHVSGGYAVSEWLPQS